MEIIITLIIIYFVGCFFEKSDYQRMRDIEKLPKFTREDANNYYKKIK